MDPISLPALSLGEGNSSGRSELAADLQMLQDAVNTLAVDSGCTPVHKTSAYTAVSGDIVLADASGGDFTVTLPPPASCAKVTVKNVGVTGTVTVAHSGSETIDGSSSFALGTQYMSRDFLSDGANWWVI